MFKISSQIVQLITRLEAPEAIFLIAKRTAQYTSSNMFTPFKSSINLPDAYLLLIVLPADAKQCIDAQSRLENALQKIADVTCWCMPLQIFNHQVKRGAYFACKVYREAERWYEAPDAALAEPVVVSSLEHDAAWSERAAAFYTAAELFILRKQLAMAAFQLHQCAEQAFTAIICNHCGYRPATHNLLLMFRYAGWFRPQLHALFGQLAPAQDTPLKHLQEAYNAVRYTNAYHIKYNELKALQQEIGLLLEYAAPTAKLTTE